MLNGSAALDRPQTWLLMLVGLGVSLLGAQQLAVAQKPPAVGYVYPPVVVAGAETEVQLGGFDFTPDMQWFVHYPHVRLETDGQPGGFLDIPPPYWEGPRAGGPSLPIPREIAGKVVVPDGTPAGWVRWQVANANGGSATALFYVSSGPDAPREILEARSRDLPQRLTELPVAVSGRLSRLTEVDRYEFVAPRSGLVVVEMWARRHGAGFRGVLEARDSQGQLLSDYSDTQGLDGRLCLSVTAGEKYIVSIRDADFQGDPAFVYRLVFDTEPRVVSTLPARWDRQASRSVTLVGYGFADGKPELQSIERTLALAEAEVQDAQRAVWRIETAAGTARVELPLGDLAERTLAELEPVGGQPHVWQLAAPQAVTGRLEAEVHEHVFQWQAEAGEFWRIDLQSRAIGGSLDVAVQVLGPNGQLLAEADDTGGTSDAALEVKIAESGLHRCVVRSLSLRDGAADEVYRLALTQPAADFVLTVPQQVNVASGGKAEVVVSAVRSGGCDAEIALVVEGLPEGVTATGALTMAAGANEAKLALEASGDAAVTAALFTIHGTATIDGRSVTRAATATAAGNLSPREPEETRAQRSLVAMTLSAPFDVMIFDRDRQNEVNRGTTFLAQVDIVRKPLKEGGEPYDGTIRLETSANQQRYRAGIRSAFVDVPPGANRALFPCFMPEWLATDLTQRMLIHGVAQVPDPQGHLRYVNKAGDARITMILEGALLKLSSGIKDIAVPAGSVVEIPVSVLRSPTFPVPTTVELVVPDEARAWLRADAITLGPAEERGVLRMETASDPRLAGAWTLTIRATSLDSQGWPVESQADVRVEFSVEGLGPAADALTRLGK
jgi:hypothetical protein